MKRGQADLFLFMGQSNMAGRGVTCEQFPETAPELIRGAGFEYRAVTAPDGLCAVQEPFGKEENRTDGIDDGERKSGSLVTAFVNAYFQETEVPVIGISASKGGSSIRQWQPGGAFLKDVEKRLDSCRKFLEKDGWQVRHVCMLWCQGETDGDHGMSGEEYQNSFRNMWMEMQRLGVETCFLILIGKYNGVENICYREVREAQRRLPELCERVVLADDSFEGMKERGLMKDEFHYYQKAYNEAGDAAGRKTGCWMAALTNVNKL